MACNALLQSRLIERRDVVVSEAPVVLALPGRLAAHGVSTQILVRRERSLAGVAGP
jgi:hypothetical protein